MTSSLELLALRVTNSNVRARRMDTGKVIIWRGDSWQKYIVEGEIFTVEVARQWQFNTTTFISGPVVDSRIDIPALDLEPLSVYLRDERPMEWEMEQIIPGEDFDGFDEDDITIAADFFRSGRQEEAYELILNLLEQDMRCIDAHVHLGTWAFGDGRSLPFLKQAIKHYTIGVELGDYFLGPGFIGRLPWGLIDNRPFLRALHGQCLCFWAFGQFEEAEAIAERLLELNPKDNLGVRYIIEDIRRGIPYRESEYSH